MKNNCKQIKQEFKRLTDLVNQFQSDFVSGKNKVMELKTLKNQIFEIKKEMVFKIFTADFHLRLIKERLIEESLGGFTVTLNEAYEFVSKKNRFSEPEETELVGTDVKVSGDREYLLEITINFPNETGSSVYNCYKYLNNPFIQIDGGYSGGDVAVLSK